MANKLFLKTRLSTLMFLQLFVFGITSPIMSLYLIKCLHFTGSQAGIVLSVPGIAMFVSPVIGTFIADKLISVERLIGACHFLGSIFMLVLSFQKSFESVLILYLLYMLVLGCTSGFVMAVVFHLAADAKKDFGGIRMWGSIGWISAGWLFSYIWLKDANGVEAFSRLGDALKVSSGVSLLLAIYTFTLPKSSVDDKKKKSFLPLEALSVIAKPRHILLSVLTFLLAVLYQYYTFGLAPFLQHNGYHESNIMPLMSLGQVSEVIALGLLGFFLVRTNYKIVMGLGLLFNIWRYVAFFLSSSFPVVLSGILCHGLCYALFSATVSIYFDSQCDTSARSGVQQILVIISAGFGTFFGSLLAGHTMTWVEASNLYWVVPVVISVVMVLAFFVGFREEASVEA